MPSLKKKEAEKASIDIKGTWTIIFCQNAFGFDAPLVIGEKEASWPKGIVNLFDEKPGKGSVKIDATKNPPTIDLKVGDKVYKGIYRAQRLTDEFKDQEDLLIILSEAGGDYPKGIDLKKPFETTPKGFKGFLFGGKRKVK